MAIIVLIFIITPSVVFAEIPDYCNSIKGKIICEISIISNKFPGPDYTPDVAFVPKDAKIFFKNDGFIPHTATSTNASPEENTYLAEKGINGIFDTGKLLGSEVSSPIILQEEGVYHYFCTVHKDMRGTIIVKDDNVENEILIQNDLVIPQWIRNYAASWSENLISDGDFISGIKFLIENNFFQIPNSQLSEPPTNSIPKWIKNNARWWTIGQISDSEFIFSIQHLVKTNIIRG